MAGVVGPARTTQHDGFVTIEVIILTPPTRPLRRRLSRAASALKSENADSPALLSSARAHRCHPRDSTALSSNLVRWHRHTKIIIARRIGFNCGCLQGLGSVRGSRRHCSSRQPDNIFAARTRTRTLRRCPEGSEEISAEIISASCGTNPTACSAPAS